MKRNFAEAEFSQRTHASGGDLFWTRTVGNAEEFCSEVI